MSDAPAASRGAPWDSRDRWTLAGLIALAVIVRAVCAHGVGYLDSWVYADASLRALEEGPGTGLGFHQTNRLGMTLPPAGFLALFGRSEAALLAYFAVLALAELVAVPLLLARVLAPRTAILATALYAATPLAIRGAATNAADAAMAAWSNAGLLCVLGATAQEWRRIAAGGLLLGCGLLHKETAVVLLPVAAAMAAFPATGADRVRRVAALCAGFALVVAVEALLFARWTGDPLFRYRNAGSFHGPSLDLMEERSLLERTLVYWPANLLASPQQVGTLLFLLPGALILHAAQRGRGTDARVVLWFAFPALYTLLGTSTLSGWRPLLPYPRYLHFVLLPAAIVAAQAIAAGAAWTRTRRLVAACAAAALLAGAVLVRTRGVEGAVAGASAVALFLVAGRAPPAASLVLVAALPCAMAAERLAGVQGSAFRAEREAVALLRREGAREVVSSSPPLWALQFMERFGQLPDVTVRARGHADLAVSPSGTLLVVPDRDAAALLAPDEGRAFEVLGRFAGASYGGLEVFVLRRR